MRKIVSILLACVLSLGILVGCKKQEPIETVEVDGEYFFNLTAEDFKKRWNDFEGNQKSQIGEWEKDISETESGVQYDFEVSSGVKLWASANTKDSKDKLSGIGIKVRRSVANKQIDEYTNRLIKCCVKLDDKEIEKLKENLEWEKVMTSDEFEGTYFMIEDVVFGSDNVMVYDDRSPAVSIALFPNDGSWDDLLK